MQKHNILRHRSRCREPIGVSRHDCKHRQLRFLDDQHAEFSHRSITERTSFSVANEDASLPNTTAPAEICREFRRRKKVSQKAEAERVVFAIYDDEGRAPEGLGRIMKQEACIDQEGRHIVTLLNRLDLSDIVPSTSLGGNQSVLSVVSRW